MELPNLGQQCTQIGCQQLDFLPLTCKCGKQFCSEHFNSHVKTCEVYIKHDVVEPKKIADVYKCSQENCEETSLVPLICERCNQHFCVKHRHLTECFPKDAKTLAEEKEKYAIPQRQFEEAKNVVDKQIQQSLNEARKKQKNVALANKVQLMKIKNKAKGAKSIPPADRVYFNITHQSEGDNEEVIPVFVSKTWSVGRAIDAIAVECKLRNDNNMGTAKKLRLLKKDTNKVITENLADPLQELFDNNVIVDGENLFMAYVSDV